MPEQRPSARVLRWLGLPVFAGTAVFLARHEELVALPGGRLLLAAADPLAMDFDLDGLILHQENILGTSDLTPDTDGDHAYDLVELARGTDPNDAGSVPTPQPVAVGMTARAEGPVLTFVTAIYASWAEATSFGYKMGVSLGGMEFDLPLNVVLSLSKIKIHPAMDPTGWIISMETAIPTAFLGTVGSLGVYSLVYAAGQPTPQAAAVVNLLSVDGQPVIIVPPPDSIHSGTGSIYKPLGRGEDIPATWEQGKVCWQLTVPVGTDGSSLILDVEAADCSDLDTACAAEFCAATVGTTQKVLDAGALAGGG